MGIIKHNPFAGVGDCECCTPDGRKIVTRQKLSNASRHAFLQVVRQRTPTPLPREVLRRIFELCTVIQLQVTAQIAPPTRRAFAGGLGLECLQIDDDDAPC